MIGKPEAQLVMQRMKAVALEQFYTNGMSSAFLSGMQFGLELATLRPDDGKALIEALNVAQQDDTIRTFGSVEEMARSRDQYLDVIVMCLTGGQDH